MIFVTVLTQALTTQALTTPGGLKLDAPGWKGHGTGGRVWPSAGALVRYIERTGACRDRRVLELGTGTGIVGLSIAKTAHSVTLTDRNVDLARRNLRKNDIHNVDTKKYVWGEQPIFDGNQEVVLGSDVTYAIDAHDDLCASLALLLVNENSTSILAHQYRPVASFFAGVGLLDHFRQTAHRHGLHVDTLDVDRPVFGPVVTILRVLPAPRK